MKNGNKVVLLIIAILGFQLISSLFVSAQNDVTIEIKIIGEEPRMRFNTQVVVAGIWHIFNVTPKSQNIQELHLIFYKGIAIPDEADRDETNYYEWKYDKNSQTSWMDIQKYGGREYINATGSTKDQNNYNFMVGIKDNLPTEPQFYHENWTLDVYEDGDKSHSENVVVEKPTIGLAKTHGDIIIFNVDPFTEMDGRGNDYFRIANRGNIPLELTVDYGDYNDILSYSVFCNNISPDSNCEFDGIVIHSEPLKPGITDFTGTVTGEVLLSYIITTTPYSFATSVGVAAPTFKIVSSHANYELESLTDNISFQYKKNLEMNEGDIENVDVYISGNGQLTLDLQYEDISVLEVFSDDVVTSTPITITTTNTSEHTVTVKIQAIRETSAAYLRYNLEIGVEQKNYTTQITVGPPASSSEGISLDNTQIIVIVVIIFLVLGYVILSQMRYRRR
jgi:hypothetical protein